MRKLNINRQRIREEQATTNGSFIPLKRKRHCRLVVGGYLIRAWLSASLSVLVLLVLVVALFGSLLLDGLWLLGLLLAGATGTLCGNKLFN